MNKAELVTKIAEKLGISKKATDEYLEATLNIIEETLKNGEEIKIIGFGSFGVAEKSGRIGRNPKTGEAVEIAPSKSVKFKVGKKLKESIN